MGAFSCKTILSFYKKSDSLKRVYLQAIIDGEPVRVALNFYCRDDQWDRKGIGRVKANHPNATDYNTEILQAIAKANKIASQFRQKEKALTPAQFIEAYENPADELNLIKYLQSQLDLKKPELSENTIKQHNTVINKVKEFNKNLRFGDLNPEMMQRFKNTLSKADLKQSTINKVLKILKQYLSEARKKGKEFEDPFKIMKIREFKSNRLSLTEDELKKIEKYYDGPECTPSHKKLLRYFLFSCYTGLRISDVHEITWANVYDDLLTYLPVKTKKKGEPVIVPLLAEKKYLPEFQPGNNPIFETYSDPVTNRYLKEVAADLGIKKNVTFHTARHTFATLMAEGGHIVETQKMLGHGDIKTTMGYVHASNKSIITAKKKRFSEKKDPNTLEGKDLKPENTNRQSSAPR